MISTYKKTFGIVGFGSRGQSFAKIILDDPQAELYAVAEPVEQSRKKAVEQFGVSQARCYLDADEFFAQGKICDAIFLCTQDNQHYQQTLKALSLGYDICLEKPAAVDIEQCKALRDEAERLNRKIMLTHVLRYAPFYMKIKELVASGKLGKVVTMNLTENIAYWHFALSYVRGPWRNAANSTPTIIAKCCHDLDLIVWFANKKCVSVNSYGGLDYYKSSNAPVGSSEYCVDCDPAVREKCLYDSFKIYPERVKLPVVGGLSVLQGSDIYEILSDRKHAFGKCVFHSDNDAPDHQIVNLLFDDGTTAHLTMTAFSEECDRSIKLHGTEGEVYGNLESGKLYYTKYGCSQEIIDLNIGAEVALSGGHGGGDYYLYKDFCNYVDGLDTSISRTTMATSIESHIIGFRAEESRLNDGKTIKV